MSHYDWNQIPEERLNPLVTRRVIHTVAMTVARLRIAKGAVVPAHRHVNEQLAMVEQGALKFDLDGEQILVSAGQALAIPSGVPHGVEAMEDSVVMDLFTPRRQDWIDGDDSYLREKGVRRIFSA
jgi:quercetin dioxygenase-like cupin family protein